MFAGFIQKTLAITQSDLYRLRHDFIGLITRAVQPALWLLFFGEVLNRARIIQTGDIPYRDFITPGVLAQSVLFVAIFQGLAVIWERDLGILSKYLVSPTPRAALVLGRALSAGVRALSQVGIIYVLALLIGVRLSWSPLALAGVLAVILLSAALFSTFSLLIACLVKTRDRFMGIGQLLTMPLFFASNAIYPVSMMPGWLRGLACVNPLSYEVDALRALMLKDGQSSFGVGVDFCVLSASTVLLVLLAARLYPRLVV